MNLSVGFSSLSFFYSIKKIGFEEIKMIIEENKRRMTNQGTSFTIPTTEIPLQSAENWSSYILLSNDFFNSSHLGGGGGYQKNNNGLLQYLFGSQEPTNAISKDPFYSSCSVWNSPSQTAENWYLSALSSDKSLNLSVLRSNKLRLDFDSVSDKTLNSPS